MNRPPELAIRLEREPSEFRPGEEVAGRVSWSGIDKIRSASVSLYWTTTGRGHSDTEVVEHCNIENPGSDDNRDFRFRLPDGPVSFAGKLITLEWGVELVVEPGQSTWVPITLGPGGKQITLPEIPKPPKSPWSTRAVPWQ